MKTREGNTPSGRAGCPQPAARWQEREAERRVMECGDLSPLSAGDSSPLGSRMPRDKSHGSESCDKSQHSKTWRLILTTFCLLPSTFCLCTHAQEFAVDWWTLDGGGGTSTGGVYAVTGTVGQPDAGQMSGGPFTLEGGFWGGATMPLPNPPRLFIQAAGGLANIGWMPATPGFVLQMSDSLSPIAWTNAPSGSTNPVSVSFSGASRFYRLKKD